MRNWDPFEWLVFFIGIVISVGFIMLFSYKIWGPHYPPAPFNPKVEFVDQCREKSGIPDVHTNKWTCEDPEN